MTQTQMNFDAQAANLARVSGKIAHAVWRFCKSHVGQTFHASDLHAAIPDVAPDSAGRILRDLRRKGMVSYTVDRPKSLYQILSVSGSLPG